MQMEIPRTPPSEEQVEAFESAFDIRLPLAYRRWLLSVGGGRPVESTLQGASIPEGLLAVAEFFHLGDAAPSDLARENGEYAGKFPGFRIAIADSLGNDLFFIDTNDGKVYYLTIDDYYGKDVVLADNFWLVADDFDQFCAKLRVIDDVSNDWRLNS